jgi:carbon starvation protein
MNSLTLLITAAIAFVFGYRFYSKLLAGGVFRIPHKYSIATEETSTDSSQSGTHRHWLMSQHFGLVATTITLSSAAMAAFWGWVPAFLWIIVGTSLAAGIYAIGVLWLSTQHPGKSLREIVLHYFRPQFWSGLLALILILLIVVAGLLLLLSSRLLVNHPSVVLPFWLQVILATGLGVFLKDRFDKAIAPAMAIALVIVLLVVWLFSYFSVGFSGALYFDFYGRSRIGLDADIAWILLLATYLYYAQRPGFAALLRPRAGFATGMFAVILLIFFVAVIVAHPVLIAPGFNPVATTPAALPFLLITVTGGALAGIYLLLAHQFTAPALRDQTDCREVGYGAVVIEGLAAVSAIIICSAGFASAAEWKQFYASWSGLQDPSYLLELYINGFVYFASYLGINANFAANLAAVTLLALTVTSLEAVLKMLRIMASEAGQSLGLPVEEKSHRSLLLLLVAIVAISANAAASESTPLIALFGASNQLLAAFGLLLLVAALERHQRPGQLILGMTLVLLPAVLWAIGLQLGAWWGQNSWGLVLLSLLLFAFGLWILVETVRVLWKPADDRGDT